MRFAFLPVVLVCLAVARPEHAAAQGPVVLHDELRCRSEDAFTIVAMDAAVSTSLRSVKLYFRSGLYPDFYYVEMIPIDGVYAAVLPKPSPETTRIVYYIEALDTAFGSARTPDVTVPVRDPCSERSSPVAALGDGSGIVVGASTGGAAALPPGFEVAGIVGTITAAGIASSVGGGLGTGALVVTAVAAGGAAGVAVATAGGAEGQTSTSSSTVPSPGSGPSGGGSTSVPSGGGASTTTSVAASPTTSTSIAASASTTVPGGSTSTTVPGTNMIVPATTSTPVTTSVIATTTSLPPTTTTSVAPPTACFNASAVGLCRLRLDASCSTGAIDSYSWTLDAGGSMNGPAAASGTSVEHTYGTRCLLTTVTNVLTVSGPGGSDSDSRQFTFLLDRADGASLSSRFVTGLASQKPRSTETSS